MAEEKSGGWESMLQKTLGYVEKAGDIWAKQELAKKGVATPTYAMQSTGNGQAVAVGQPSDVRPPSDEFLNTVNNLTNKTAMVAGASELRKMMPYAVGGVALAVAIYLLTKK